MLINYVDYFKALSEEAGIPCQSLINRYLHDCMLSEIEVLHLNLLCLDSCSLVEDVNQVTESEQFTIAEAHRFGKSAVDITFELAGIELDFSVESLGRVDELMAAWHDEGRTCESMLTTVYLYGCYLGEVIIRNYGGTWRETAEMPNGEIFRFPVVLELSNGTMCNPLGKACKLIDNGMEDSLAFFCQVVTAL
jgi:hypothetical protein